MKKMLEELQRRNYSQATVRAYLLAVRRAWSAIVGMARKGWFFLPRLSGDR